MTDIPKAILIQSRHDPSVWYYRCSGCLGRVEVTDSQAIISICDDCKQEHGGRVEVKGVPDGCLLVTDGEHTPRELEGDWQLEEEEVVKVPPGDDTIRQIVLDIADQIDEDQP